MHTSRGIARRIARRHRLTAIFFVLLLVILLLPWLVIFSRSEPTPPSRPIPVQAVIVPQGVEVTWQPAQTGTYPIGGYIVQKRGVTFVFTQIGHVEKESRSFIDPKGKAGDVYRIITHDTQQPFRTSAASDTLVAKDVVPGSNVANSTSNKPGYIAPTASTAAGKAQQLAQSLNAALGEYQPAVNSKDDAVIQANLTLIQQYQRAALGLFPSLSNTQKQPFIQLCSTYGQELNANISLLSEALRPDGQLALAACSAMSGEDL